MYSVLRKNAGTLWDARDMCLLASMYKQGRTYYAIARELGRSEGAVRSRLGMLRTALVMAEYKQDLVGVEVKRKRIRR